MSNQTVGQIFAKWEADVSAQASQFQAQVEQVTIWDAVLRRHYAGLGRLAEDVNELKVGQKKLDGTLDAIEGHQRMMDDTLSVSEECVVYAAHMSVMGVMRKGKGRTGRCSGVSSACLRAPLE